MAGARNRCRQRPVVGILGRDGAFADLVAVSDRYLHWVHEDVPDDAAVFVDPLVSAFRILEQVDVSGKVVVIIGDGWIGKL